MIYYDIFNAGNNIYMGRTPDELNTILNHTVYMGYKHVRLVIAWGDWGENGYTWTRTEYENRLEAQLIHVGAAQDKLARHGIKATLDMHHPFGGFKNTKTQVVADKTIRPIFYDHWEYLVKRYKDNDFIRGFEIINEPVGGQKKLNKVYGNCVEIIRSHSNKYVLLDALVGDPDNLNEGLYQTYPRNRKTIYVAHYYDPARFTHQGFLGYPDGVSCPRKRRITEGLSNILEFQDRFKAKVILNEFGASKYAPNADGSSDQTLYVETIIDWCKEHKIPWNYHATGDGGLFDDPGGGRFHQMIKNKI